MVLRAPRQPCGVGAWILTWQTTKEPPPERGIATAVKALQDARGGLSDGSAVR